MTELESIARYGAFAVPITVAILHLARFGLEWLRQSHTIQSARIDQGHSITTQYLDRALDPTLPLAIRHQLLRFLAISDKSGTRLNIWAATELERVGDIVERTDKAVTEAETALIQAKTSSDIASAERSLIDAMRNKRSLFEPPTELPVSAEALKAGLIKAKVLNGLVMIDADLQGMSLTYRKLQAADFSGCNLTEASLQGCDLRQASFVGATLMRTSFPLADLRSADFTNANLSKASFAQSHLEGANFSGANLTDVDLKASYDSRTIWPAGFDPKSAGGVFIGDNP